jgi:biotin synthase
LKEKEFETLLKAVKKIKTMTALECNCSLGTLSDEMAEALAEAGVSEYNHNLETAPHYFSRICTTHTFNDRVKTVRRVKTAGMKACCGGIIGMGESRKGRIALAFSLKKLNVDCVTVNVLNPRPGTPLAKREPLTPMEIIKTVAIFRLILPSAVIKIAGGREVNLRSLQSLALLAGGNGMIVEGYLTTSGQGLKDDLQMVKDLGFKL